MRFTGRLLFGVIIMIFGAVSSPLQAQTPARFTSDSVAFFDEMSNYLISSRKEDGKKFMKVFEEDWYGGVFKQEHRDGIYKLTNLMLKKKKRPFPDFKNYLFSVTKFAKSKFQDLDRFKQWQGTLIKLLDLRNKRKFNEFLQISNDLFEYGSFYVSPSVEWSTSNQQYFFEYDSLPKIVFPAMDLIGYSKGDSTVIYNTQGVYYPTEGKWYGKGGRITWERAGFSPDSVYAEFDNYFISLKSPKFTINDVLFYDYDYFSEPLRGTVNEKVLANMTPEKTTYPRFISKGEQFTLKDLTKGLDYVGGFSLQGRKVLGTATESGDAALYYSRGDTLMFKASAKRFVIRPDRITSSSSSISFYLNNDSIFHPGLNFQLLRDKRKLTLFKEGKGSGRTPFFNSYHEMDMDFEAVYWNLDDPKIEMQNLDKGTKTDAFFQSADFFRMDYFRKLAGMRDKHPLIELNRLSRKLDTNSFSLADFSNHMRLSHEQSQSMIMKLATLGFLLYDYPNKNITVKQRLKNTVKSSAKKKDYDVISIFSNIPSQSNATLSLINYDLLIRGVRRILLSDSHQVYVFPSDQQVILKKNRDFAFKGKIQAGRFDVFGRELFFEYDAFKFNLTNVDSVRIFAETGKKRENGTDEIKPVKTVIENVNGELLIDKEINKSGIKPYHKYPIFKSFTDSYVFYDRKEVQGGVYGKESFYFHLEPFEIDSLDDFDNSALTFKGKFVSAGIFPDFEEKITLQPDHSLGFVRETPPGGFDVYEGKGQFISKIKLSYEGLRGDGTIKYIASTTKSADFIFYPDSMTAAQGKYTIKENPVAVEFPPAQGENLKVHWRPKKDFMTHQQKEKPIRMYDMKSMLHGISKVTPDGLSGSGMFEFEKAELDSREIKFKFEEFTADTSDFRLKDQELAGELTFSTTNVNAYVTFKDRYGKFTSNGEGSFIDFPQNEYICFMNEFKWFMDTENIELSADNVQEEDALGVKLDGAQFISVHPHQDSLSFYSTKAQYDLRKKIVNAGGVKYINVADAMIYPNEEKVVVRKKAKMDPLDSASIVANFTTKNFNIYNVNARILGKKKYLAKGVIDYIDDVDNKFTISLPEIKVDSSGQTFALGEIKQEEKFALSPFFEYYGQVNLFANNEYLLFEGNAKVKHDCDLLPNDWFTFKGEINPLDIYIPIDSTTRGLKNDPFYVGTILSSDSLGVYSTFMNPKVEKNHDFIIPVNGYLYYDKKKETYKVSNKDKIVEQSLTGNYLELNTKDCKIKGEGIFDLGIKSGQVKIQTAGSMIHNQIDDEAIFDLTMVMDFFFANDALKKMNKQVQEFPDLQAAKLDRKVYELALREMAGKDVADKLISQLNLYGEFKKMPDLFKKTIVFNEAKFKWNNGSKSYKSFGKLGIASIGDKQVNRMVNGKIELIKKKSGDEVIVYLELDPNNWYFFHYARGMLQSISSNEEFNADIQAVKPDKRKVKPKKGEEAYRFMYSTVRKKRDFVRKFDSN